MGGAVAQWPDGQCAAFQIEGSGFEARGPFLDGLGKLSHLMITELFYSHILNMN